MSQILNLFKTGKIIKNGERNKNENKKSRKHTTKQKKTVEYETAGEGYEKKY